jgi:formylglycine-generating enzyme required for sulfatase activity
LFQSLREVEGMERYGGEGIANGLYRIVTAKQGGFFEVLIVEDGPLRRAIKCVPKQRWQSIPDENKAKIAARFANECLVWQLQLKGCPHSAEAVMAFPNFYELGPVLFMEVVDGPSVSELRERQGRLSLTQTVHIASEIAEAMMFAHARDVRHRDLTLSNILLSSHNDVKVIDWGLCSVRGEAGDEAYTPGYASPQRISKPALDDAKDDMFAFGVCLFKCLTGQVPDRTRWEDDEISDALKKTNPFLPDTLLRFILDALKFSPEDRPTFQEAVRELNTETFVVDVQQRERKNVFCPKCGFVSVSTARVSRCPLCGESCRERVPGPTQPGMRRIPEGPFIQGIDRDQGNIAFHTAGFKDVNQEQIEELAGDGQRKVFLPDFDIDTFPVTNAQFDAFCRAVNYPKPKNFEEKRNLYPDHPVINVTWRDAICYALWRGKRLPTPLEWEKAARGDKDDRVYPWKGPWDKNRCNSASYIRQTETTDVKTFTQGKNDGRSLFGVADMAGNVREWVSQGDMHGMRGLRGGSWGEGCVIEGLVSYQRDAAVDYKDELTGFRCAADIPFEEQLIAGEVLADA